MITESNGNGDNKIGRPTIKPGEPSIDCHFSLEISTHRQLRQFAQLAREPIQDVVRAAVREFLAKNLTGKSS